MCCVEPYLLTKQSTFLLGLGGGGLGGGVMEGDRVGCSQGAGCLLFAETDPGRGQTR